MILEVHTHIFWYPDRIDLESAQEGLEAKLVRIERSGGRAHAKKSLDSRASKSAPSINTTILVTQASGLYSLSLTDLGCR